MSQTSQAASPGVAAGVPTHRTAVLSLILCVQLLNAIDITVMNMALPQIQSSLGFTPTSLSWVINAYTLAYGGLLLLGGRLGDILGQRRALMIGVTLFTSASLAGGLAQEPWWLLTSRAVQGAGAALATPTTMALIVRLFTDAAERTKALGVTVMASGIGSAGGLLLGGLLTDLGTWRWVLFINVPVGVAVLLAAPRVIPPQEAHEGGFDAVGAITATLAMTALVFGFVQAASEGFRDTIVISAFVVGAVLFAALLVVETRHPAPILNFGLFKERNRAAGFGVFACSGAAMFGMFFFLTQFVQEVLEFSPLQAGLAFLAMAAPMTAVPRLVTPKIVKSLGPKLTMMIGLFLVAVSMFWLTQMDSDTTYLTGVFGPMALAGAGVGLLNPPLAATILATVAPKEAGGASGLLQTVAMIGASVGTAILVAIFGAAVRGEASVSGVSVSPEALTFGISRAYVGSLVFVLLGLAIVTFIIRAPKPAAQTATPDRQASAVPKQNTDGV